MNSVHTFRHDGRTLAYRELGSGPRTIVLTHGLLMDSRMFTHLAPVLAERGHRVLLLDVLGHGASEQPYDMTAYSMTAFGEQVIALLDHLGIEQAVVGGTSLGANTSLEAAVVAPERVRALVLEMPVLENALAAAAGVFVPLALLLRVFGRSMKGLSRLMRLIPRSHYLIDIPIDFVRRDPAASLAVLDGITFGRVAPPVSARRKLTHPTLVIGHQRDPIHPFSDADRLLTEMRSARLIKARSILEWRVLPARLDAELCRFLDDVWSAKYDRRPAPAAQVS